MGFIFGIFIGSFLNVCIDRLPEGQSIVRPPSHCPACSRRLALLDLVPIISYLWLRGRCRYCRAGIPLRVPVIEAAAGVLLALLALRYGLGIEFAVLAFYCLLFLVLAVIDLKKGLILNIITYPALVISLILSPFWPDISSSRPFLWDSTMLNSFLGSLLGFGIFALLFLAIVLLYKEGMGWGDVKMAGLVGLAAGFPLVLVAMAVSFLAGGVAAVFLLLLRLKGRKEGIPYGPFLALGAVVALIWGERLLYWYLDIVGVNYQWLTSK